jgi:hypothetical protein
MRKDRHMQPKVSCLTIKSRTVRFVIEAIHPLNFRIIHLWYSQARPFLLGVKSRAQEVHEERPHMPGRSQLRDGN